MENKYIRIALMMALTILALITVEWLFLYMQYGAYIAYAIVSLTLSLIFYLIITAFAVCLIFKWFIKNLKNIFKKENEKNHEHV